MFFVYKLMIGSSKISKKIFREKETRVKFNLGLSANQPSNNWHGPWFFFLGRKDFLFRRKDFVKLRRSGDVNFHRMQMNLGMSI